MTYDKTTIIKAYQSGLSYPQLHKKYGISISYAAFLVRNAGINRSISEALILSKSAQVEWKKLSRMTPNKNNPSPTRVISIPAEVLLRLGKNINVGLLGKWVIENGKLILEIKEVMEK